MTIHEEVEADLAQIAPRDVNPAPYGGLDSYTSNYSWGGDSKEPLATQVRAKGSRGVGLVHQRFAYTSHVNEKYDAVVAYTPAQKTHSLWHCVQVIVPRDPGVRLVFENTVERFKQ